MIYVSTFTHNDINGQNLSMLYYKILMRLAINVVYPEKIIDHFTHIHTYVHITTLHITF